MSSGDKAPAVAAAAAGAPSPPHPPSKKSARASAMGWECLVEGSTGKKYYWNTTTGKTAWNLPADLAPPSRRKRYTIGGTVHTEPNAESKGGANGIDSHRLGELLEESSSEDATEEEHGEIPRRKKSQSVMPQPTRSSNKVNAFISQRRYTEEVSNKIQRDRAKSHLRRLASCQGWLNKKTSRGVFKHRYKRRWFTLHLSVLEYWTKEQKPKEGAGARKNPNHSVKQEMASHRSKRFLITPSCVISASVEGEPKWTIELRSSDAPVASTEVRNTTLNNDSPEPPPPSRSPPTHGGQTTCLWLQCESEKQYHRWLRELKLAHAEICEVNGDRVKLAGLAFGTKGLGYGNNRGKSDLDASLASNGEVGSAGAESASRSGQIGAEANVQTGNATSCSPDSMTLEEILVGALLDSLISITKGKRHQSVLAMDQKVTARLSSIEPLTTAKAEESTRVGIVDKDDEVWYDDVHRTPFGARVFAPGAFARIRRAHGCNDTDYRLSIMQGFTGKAAAGDGKSGQLFLLTKDKRLVMKTLKGYEMVFFEKILPRYCHHLDMYPGSLLCRFYDVVTLTEPGSNATISIVVMPNLFFGAANHFPGKGALEIFDLKGSVRNRNVTQEEIKSGVSTLKDLNFNRRCSELGNGIMLPSHLRSLFFKQLDVDGALLRELDIMDYSLLLGVATETSGLENSDATNQGDRRSSRMHEHAAFQQTNPLHSLSAHTWHSYKGGIRSAPLAYCGDRASVREVYYMSVIDILQEFDFSKRMENRYKSLRRNENLISAVSAARYANRFVSYIANRSGPQVPREAPGQLSQMCLDNLSAALAQSVRAERMRSGRGIRLGAIARQSLQWRGGVAGSEGAAVDELRAHQVDACRSTHYQLLISRQFKCTYKYRCGDFYSISDVAAPVFRTLRHAWGYDDDTYLQLLESGFERFSSYRGPGEREVRFYGVDIDHLGKSNSHLESSREQLPAEGKPPKLDSHGGKDSAGGSDGSPTKKTSTIEGEGIIDEDLGDDVSEEDGKGASKRPVFDDTHSFRCYSRGVAVKHNGSKEVSKDTGGAYSRVHYETHRSREILVKAISESAYDNILSSLPSYCEHMCANPRSSLLTRILGMYKIGFVKGGDEKGSPEDIKDCCCIVLENNLLPVTTVSRTGGSVEETADHHPVSNGSHIVSEAPTSLHFSCSSMELLQTYSLKGSKGRNRTVERSGSKSASHLHTSTKYVPSAHGEDGLMSGAICLQKLRRDESNSTDEQFQPSPVVCAMSAGLGSLNLMDLDFDAGSDYPICLPKSQAVRLLESLSHDFEYLKGIGAMNYGVHVGIYKRRDASEVIESFAVEKSGFKLSPSAAEDLENERDLCLSRHNCFSGWTGEPGHTDKLFFTFAIHKIDHR